MEKNFALINIINLIDNIKYFKSSYNYEHYILNVSNGAFSHGMEIIKYLNEEFDYLYTSNFNDVKNIRKYRHDIKIIYDGFIDENNIYDLILNNAILIIKSKEIMDFILSLKIKDKFEIIFRIDVNNFNGFGSKHELADILEDIKKDIHIHILGVISDVVESNYLEFKYIMTPLTNLELIILNNENDKNNIKGSNAIIVDKSIYGIDVSKKKLFSKEISKLKPVLEINSYIDKVVANKKGKKDIYLGVMPFGLKHGMTKNITKVYINDKFYNIREIKDSYTLIEIDDYIKEKDIIELIGTNNRLDFYIKDGIFNYMYCITSTLEISYEKGEDNLIICN